VLFLGLGHSSDHADTVLLQWNVCSTGWAHTGNRLAQKSLNMGNSMAVGDMTITELGDSVGWRVVDVLFST
jgi:hypothetical protein